MSDTEHWFWKWPSRIYYVTALCSTASGAVWKWCMNTTWGSTVFYLLLSCAALSLVIAIVLGRRGQRTIPHIQQPPPPAPVPPSQEGAEALLALHWDAWKITDLHTNSDTLRTELAGWQSRVLETIRTYAGQEHAAAFQVAIDLAAKEQDRSAALKILGDAIDSVLKAIRPTQ